MTKFLATVKTDLGNLEAFVTANLPWEIKAVGAVAGLFGVVLRAAWAGAVAVVSSLFASAKGA